MVAIFYDQIAANHYYGTIERTSSRKLAGDGMSSSSPQTSTISSTEVAGKRSFWNAVRTLDEAFTRASSLFLVHSARADGQSLSLAGAVTEEKVCA
jgi:hypothetical protein